METILARLYLSIIFGILVILNVFLILRIKLKLSLKNEFTNLTSKCKTKDLPYLLGRRYLREKMYNKAITEFRYSLAIWDKSDLIGLTILLNFLGVTYFKLEEYGMAINFFETALTVSPYHIVTLINLSYVYQYRADLNRLESIYDRLIMLDDLAVIENPILTKRIEELKNYLKNEDS